MVRQAPPEFALFIIRNNLQQLDFTSDPQLQNLAREVLANIPRLPRKRFQAFHPSYQFRTFTKRFRISRS